MEQNESGIAWQVRSPTSAVTTGEDEEDPNDRLSQLDDDAELEVPILANDTMPAAATAFDGSAVFITAGGELGKINSSTAQWNENVFLQKRRIISRMILPSRRPSRCRRCTTRCMNIIRYRRVPEFASGFATRLCALRTGG